MIINFFPDGSVQHTLKDNVFKMPGRRKIERVTDIRFDEREQKFYIYWRGGPFAERVQTVAMALAYGVKGDFEMLPDATATMYFMSYDEAVALEVLMLDALRLAGEKF